MKVLLNFPSLMSTDRIRWKTLTELVGRQTLPLRGTVVPEKYLRAPGRKTPLLFTQSASAARECCSSQVSLMKRDVHIRKDVYANVMLSSGTTIFQGVGEHVTAEVAPSTMNFKVVASPV